MVFVAFILEYKGVASLTKHNPPTLPPLFPCMCRQAPQPAFLIVLTLDYIIKDAVSSLIAFIQSTDTDGKPAVTQAVLHA